MRSTGPSALGIGGQGGYGDSMIGSIGSLMRGICLPTGMEKYELVTDLPW